MAVKLKAARQQLAQFVQATGGRQDSAWESVSGFGRSAAGKATWAAKKAYAKAEKDAILIETLRKAGNLPKTAQIHLTPKEIDVKVLSFDDKHINGERHHNITEEKAKQYIQNAVFSATVWGGQYERYYGSEGVVYVNISTSSIRTAYGKAEFDDTLKNLVKELEQNGLLGERGVQAE